MKTKKVIVYHDNETLAHRARRPRIGETVSYRAKSEWDAKVNESFDEVIDLSTKKIKTKKDEDGSCDGL